MMPVLRIFAAASTVLLLTSCSDINYDRTPVGKLAGILVLEWIDQDKFQFLSDGTDPLKFVRANNEVIQPGPMFTDGGSIPAPLRAIKSFSPWGYAPAFIIHDWLFVMKQCKLPGYEKWDHLQAAEVFSEVMKTMMENPKFGGPNKLVHLSMYEAVRTDVAKRYWDEGGCNLPGGRKRSLGTVRSAAPEQDDRARSGGTRSLSALPSSEPVARAARSPTTRLRTVVQY